MIGNELEFQPSDADLGHLREWLAKSPHLLQNYDDKILSAFVRGCKGSLQKTKKILEGFNSLGQRYPNIMRNYDPLDQRLVDHLSESLTFPLPKRTPDGSTVFIVLLRNTKDFKSDPYKCQSSDFLRYWFLSLYVQLWNNDFGSGKWILINNFQNVTLTHARDITPVSLKQALKIAENALPIRLQAVHLIKVPPSIEYVFNVIKSMTRKKISERIYFHSTMETFYEKVPKEILPKEYGGSEESVLTLHERWYETVKSFRKELLEEESEMRRLDPLRPKTEDEEEMVGSFKSLVVD